MKNKRHMISREEENVERSRKKLRILREVEQGWQLSDFEKKWKSGLTIKFRNPSICD